MNFTSTAFFVFLGLTLTFWYLGQRFLTWPQQKLTLIFFSVLFYCSWSVFYGIIFVSFCLFVYRAAIYLDGSQGPNRRMALIAILSVPVMGLFVFKYFSFALSTASAIAGDLALLPVLLQVAN